VSEQQSKAKVGGLGRRGAVILFLLVLAVLIALAGWRLRERLAPVESMPPPPLTVETITVEAAPFRLTGRYRGSIEAERRAALPARINSTVRRIAVREGASVAAGELLLVLDATEQEQEIRRLEAVLEGVRSDLDYWEGQLRADRRLYEKGTIDERTFLNTRRQVQSLAAAREEAQESLAQARTRLGYTRITAPFAGVVQALLVDEGEGVAPGTPLLDLIDTDTLKAVISVPQVDSARLRPEAPVQLHTGKEALPWSLTVDRIRPALEPRSRNATFEIGLPADAAAEVVPGMAVTAEVELERHAGVLQLPLAAVRESGTRTGVYLVEEGSARWQEVETGPISGERVWIRAGLAGGEEVIITPYPTLENGRAVTVHNNEEGASS